MATVLSMPRPMCLVENDGHNLVVNKAAINFLSEISKPVIVVAIAGKYRTGKSFLMNRLAGLNSGFPLGSSIQSKTKGIWMWCIPHPQKPGHVLVLLDTEGLGDVEKGDSKNDTWIFSLTVLLCSALIYNSMGSIDQQAIEQLHYVTELTKMIKLKSTDTKDDSKKYKSFLPSFTWCVRDFSLVLERNGEEITEDEYLMMSLQLKQGDNVQNYNLPRQCIRNFFHSHKCFVFDRPTSMTAHLHRLDKLKESEIETEFMENAVKFYNHIMKSSRVKTLTGGIKVTGKMLGFLTSLYVDTIQSGSIPTMENAVLALAEIENSGAMQDAMSQYICEMEKLVPKFPTVSELEFLRFHRTCMGKATDVFMKRSLNKDPKYLQELENQISKKSQEFKKIDEDRSREMCNNLIKNLSMTMQNGLMQGRYSKSGGHTLFLMDKRQFLEKYKRMPGKGAKSFEVLENFLYENKNIEAAILKAEKNITERERQIAVSHTQSMQAKRQRQSVEKQNRDLQRSLNQQSASHQQHINSFTEMMQRNRERMAQENASVLNRRIQEQQYRLNSSYQPDLDRLQRTLADLQSENFQNHLSVGGECILC